jgi:hypothetical protein
MTGVWALRVWATSQARVIPTDTRVFYIEIISIISMHISHARRMVTYTTGQELSVPCCCINDFMLYHLVNECKAFYSETTKHHAVWEEAISLLLWDLKQFLKAAADVSLKKNISTIGYGAKYFLFTWKTEIKNHREMYLKLLMNNPIHPPATDVQSQNSDWMKL